INGPVVNDALKDPNNPIAKLVAKEKDDAKVVQGIYLALLGRHPSKRELEIGVSSLRGARDVHMEMVAEHAKLQANLDAHLKQLDGGQPEWEASLKRQPVWTVLQPETLKAAGAALSKLPDGSVLAGGKNPTPETYTVTAKT